LNNYGKSPNKFNGHACRENLTTANGNDMISAGGKIQIKMSNMEENFSAEINSQ
jgi:hypothetical protein